MDPGPPPGGLLPPPPPPPPRPPPPLLLGFLLPGSASRISRSPGSSSSSVTSPSLGRVVPHCAASHICNRKDKQTSRHLKEADEQHKRVRWPKRPRHTGAAELLVTAKGETVVTGYATDILRALELEHPAARLLRLAAQSQAEQSGDGAAFVVPLPQALLAQAGRRLRAGLPRAQLREA
ncbi:hypothetical protein J1605_016075 [Eschrichtius robustus]|uniref:Uncharacterized protein n=1 Tax=Eschrichtius robustus TaxID=9764 RepID=A0AB34G7W9_ESCRO|nr:hypothetical protein J1605_016075 [Eschrichtius robustus]